MTLVLYPTYEIGRYFTHPLCGVVLFATAYDAVGAAGVNCDDVSQGEGGSIIFRMLIRLGSFPEYWRSDNVTAILKGAPSPDRKAIDP